MIDPLAVTVDAVGRRWIRCTWCAGSGIVPVLVREADGWEQKGVKACPGCNGTGQVEVP